MVKSYTDMLLVPFAKYLAKYASKWELTSFGTSVMIPKENYRFDSLMFKPKQLFLSGDRSWEFVASVVIVEGGKFDSKYHTKVFQRLKGFECVMVQKGLFKKSRFMASNSILEKLKEEAIPDLTISSEIVDLINNDTSLMSLFSLIKPENVNIQLYSPLKKSKTIDEYYKQFKSLYENPESIIWNVLIERFLDSIVTRKSYERTLDAIIEALNLLSIHLKKISEGYLLGG